MWKGKKETPGYKNWLVNHECQANHKRLFRRIYAMKPAGIVKMFHRSIEKNQLRYTRYIGD